MLFLSEWQLCLVRNICAKHKYSQSRAQNIDLVSNVMPRPGRLYARQRKYMNISFKEYPHESSKVNS